MSGNFMALSILTGFVLFAVQGLAFPEPGSQDPNENETDPYGIHLVIAITKGNLTAVRDLVEKGVDVNYDGGEPILQASKRGELDIVKYLLEAGAQPGGLAVLSGAAEINRVDILDTLLEAGATFATDEYSEGVLDAATRNGHLAAVQRLLQAGADPNRRGGWAINLAAARGYVDIVKAFIEAGANINEGYVLSEAAETGHLEVAKILVEAGADEENKDFALYLAADSGHLNITKYLVEQGANPNGDESLNGACQNGHLEVARVLLDAGANITCGGYDAICPWHYAAQNGHSVMLPLLAEYGADITIALKQDQVLTLGAVPWTDVKGFTAVHVAAKFGQSIAKDFVDLGVDINQQDDRGRTPLQVAIQNFKYFVAEDLLKYCADLAPVNEDGKAALDLAEDLMFGNESDTSEFQPLMDIMRNVMPEKIASTPFNYAARKALREELMAQLETNSTLKEEFEDVHVSHYKVSMSLTHLFEERARDGFVRLMDDQSCKASFEETTLDVGTELVAQCSCIPGKGPKMTASRVRKTKQCVTSSAATESD